MKISRTRPFPGRAAGQKEKQMRKIRTSKADMESRIYEMMDWAAIEAVVYAEEAYPGKILGPHVTPEGILIQCFFPGREEVLVKTAGRAPVPMVREDEAGFFAVLLDGRRIPAYTFLLKETDDLPERELADPYAFPPQITAKEEKSFQSGTWLEAGTKLGAHRMTVNGTEGVLFALWAPNAVRVSVVGDFNRWDGRACPMNRLESGIFELFIPGIPAGALYKYELKLRTGLVYLKTDPFGSAFQMMPETAAVVTDPAPYEWHDQNWMDIRIARQAKDAPIAVYELDLTRFHEVFPQTAAEEEAASGDGNVQADDVSYRGITPVLLDHLLAKGYTHVEFLPLAEYPQAESDGYGSSGFFAPTSRYGTPEDFCFLTDSLHRAGIGVLMDWQPGYFAAGNDFMSSFDGTCLYEHLDPRQGVHPVYGTHIFNYGRGEVRSFLLSSAMFWLKTCHLDGLRIPELESMLYLDYGRQYGQWIANMYGGNENLEAEDFIRTLNRTVRKEVPGALMLAEERTGWPAVTGEISRDGLGFDYKWNNGCLDDYMRYIQLDPLFRGSHQNDLTFSMVYMYTERFMLALSHREAENRPEFLRKMMPGSKEALKLANLRLTCAYLMMHPGKKLFYMGQDLPGFTEDLLRLYKSHPALFGTDEDADGFEWISNLDTEKSLLVFLRHTADRKEELLVVCNFSNVEYDDLRVGVPAPGRYKELFNSDAVQYGGSGAVNPRVKLSKPVEQDERNDSIRIKVPPLGVAVFEKRENPLKK